MTKLQIVKFYIFPLIQEKLIENNNKSIDYIDTIALILNNNNNKRNKPANTLNQLIK